MAFVVEYQFYGGEIHEDCYETAEDARWYYERRWQLFGSDDREFLKVFRLLEKSPGGRVELLADKDMFL